MREPACTLSGGIGVYEIADGLFQSAWPEKAGDWDTLWALATVLVDLMGEGKGCEIPVNKMLLRWPIEDGPLPDLEVLRPLAELLAGFLEAGMTVAVLCGAGANRSGLLSALIVRELSGVTGRQAADHVRASRPGALINGAFNAYLHALPLLEDEFYHAAREPEQDAEIEGLRSPEEQT